jgi:peptide/nickel transport system substrate-binding protein/oligopeptide transport system substrate-binding protein
LAFIEAPMVFLYFYNELYAVQPWITGFKPPVIFNGQRWMDVSIGKR